MIRLELLVICSAACSLMMLSGCANQSAKAGDEHGGEVCTPVDSTAAKQGPADTTGMVKVANRSCPVVQGDAIPGQWSKPHLVVEWKGQSIGLCCPGCKPKWNAMSDAQKDAAVKKAM